MSFSLALRHQGRPAHRSSHSNPVGNLAAEHPGLVRVSRFGWLAKGIVYLISGVLALLVAARSQGLTDGGVSGSQEASPTGAIKEVAGHGPGVILLWVLAAGMILYALWRVVAALMPGGYDAKAMVHRIGYLISAIIYTTFAVTAVALTRSSGETPDGNRKVTDITASVMKVTAGRWILGLAGVVVVAAGLYHVVKGFKQDINDELDLSGLPPMRARWTRITGAVGEAGRGIGIALVGFFLCRSALTYDPNEATGLDGALRRLIQYSWGVAAVAVVGIGFVAYGLFCSTTFTHRRLEAP